MKTPRKTIIKRIISRSIYKSTVMVYRCFCTEPNMFHMGSATGVSYKTNEKCIFEVNLTTFEILWMYIFINKYVCLCLLAGHYHIDDCYCEVLSQ